MISSNDIKIELTKNQDPGLIWGDVQINDNPVLKYEWVSESKFGLLNHFEEESLTIRIGDEKDLEDPKKLINSYLTVLERDLWGSEILNPIMLSKLRACISIHRNMKIPLRPHIRESLLKLCILCDEILSTEAYV